MGLIQTHRDELFCSSEVGNLGEGGRMGSQASPARLLYIQMADPVFFPCF